MEWRYRHVKMVQRTTNPRGTGGTREPTHPLAHSTSHSSPICGPSVPRLARSGTGRPQPLRFTPTRWPHTSRFGVSHPLIWHRIRLGPTANSTLTPRPAARFVDDKWDRAFEQAELGTQSRIRLLGDAGRTRANTHELGVRLLSHAVKIRPRFVTTTGEFHTIRRPRSPGRRGHGGGPVPEAPLESLSSRLGRAMTPHRAGSVSAVFFDRAASAWPGRRRRDLQPSAPGCSWTLPCAQRRALLIGRTGTGSCLCRGRRV